MKRHKTKTKPFKKDFSYLDKIARKHLVKRTKYFHRDLHLNHKSLGIKILRLKNLQHFYEGAKGLKEMNPNICYFLYHIYYEDLSDCILNTKDCEVVITDCLTNKIIGFNSNTKKYPDFVNVWIVKQKIPELISMKIDDLLFTR